MIKKIAVLTSGGDAPGMNAAIRAVVRVALNQDIEVYGIYDGFKGLLKNNIKKLSKSDVSDILDRGGTTLGSARLVEFKEESYQIKAKEILESHGIDALVVIGGDGSYKGALALSKLGIKTVGLPGTIDNDILGTDFTIGFDTALNTVVEAVDKLRDTSSSHHRCSIVEVMGNRCGDLAFYSAISCGAEIVVTPETGFDEVELLERLEYFYSVAKKRHAIVIISEKITDVHAFARKVSQNTGFSGRATILGHVQRGGSPTPQDRVLASRMGQHAVACLLEGRTSRCVSIVDNKIVDLDIEEALNQPKKSRKGIMSIFNQLI